ncbi:MAG: beta-mannosidase [Planctomycetota bacterium]|jgi:hypothetical protein
MRGCIPLTEGWHVRQLEPEAYDVDALIEEATAPGPEWFPASMPAQVREVLLAHGRISDPRVGKNAAESTWVADKEWAYACTFAGPDQAGGPVFMRFEGSDTLASAYLNGAHIGDFANMFRPYVVDVREHLARSGAANTLLVVFRSPTRYAQDVQQPDAHVGRIARCRYVRRPTVDSVPYLGARPHAIKVGIHRDVLLDIPDRSWIEDVCVRTELADDHSRAVVRARVDAEGAPAGLDWRLTGPAGDVVAQGRQGASPDGFDLAVEMADPQLWWPRTHGVPHLYGLDLALQVDGETVDSRRINVGIRDVRPVLVDPDTGEPRLKFEVNGRPVFLQGACWAPVEGMSHCWRHETAIRLLDLVEQAHMNILRVWAEGNVPPEEFYDECDRRGILIWQDFMFGWGMHPIDYPGFEANCRAEVEGMIRRLRSHPCILLWVGGNENHMGWDFEFGGEPTIGRELFEQLMPEACARLDPPRHFHISSPYGGRAPNWPLEGDWHDYSHRTYFHRSSLPLFPSELNRVSAPSLSSMKRFLSEEEIWPPGYEAAVRKPGEPAWPPMWQYRSDDGSWDKVGRVEEFCDPASPADLIRVLGTAHGEYLQRRIERLRRGVPDGAPDGPRRSWGNVIWRLNDPWPIIYMALVDYYLEPKIAYYYARRAYAPVLVCFEHTEDELNVWVVNDSPAPVEGTLSVRRVRFDGEERGRLDTDVSVEPGESRRCLDTVDLGAIQKLHEFLLADFAGIQATHLLKGERYLHLPPARLSALAKDGGVQIAADAFARQVTLEMEGVTGAVFDDNIFDMVPGQTRDIGVLDAAGGKRVTVRALNAEPVTVEL